MKAIVVDHWMTPDSLGVCEYDAPPMTKSGVRRCRGSRSGIKLNRVLSKNIAIIGLHWSAYPEREPERIDDCFKGLFEMVARGDIEPRVSARYPREEAGHALEALAGRRTVGKIVLVP